MAVLSMKRINLYALKKDRKLVLEMLQRLGVIEISSLDYKEPNLQNISTDSSQLTFKKNADIAKNAIEILEKNLPEKKGLFASLNGRKIISKKDYYKFVENTNEIMKVASEIINLDRSIVEKKAEISKKENRIESLKPWVLFDIPLRFKGTKNTQAFIGAIPGERDKEEILAELFKNLPESENIHIEIISKSPEQTCVFVLCMKNDAENVNFSLRAMGFSLPTLPPKLIPSEKIKVLYSEIKQLKKEIEENENEIKKYVGFRNSLKFIEDYHQMRAEKYDVISKLLYTDKVFILSGYIIQKNVKKLEAILNKNFDLALEIEDPSDTEDAPIALKNVGFVSPVEDVLEGYSLPGKRDLDPTAIMAIFYYVLFGMMLSDAAYGLIICLACGFVLLKVKNLEDKIKRAMKMFFFCGVSTIFWGVMFGSYFGDATEIISKTFFNTNITIPPVWFTPVNDPMRLLSFCLAIGILHIFIGLFLGVIKLILNKKYLDIFLDIIPWYLLVGGAVAYVLSIKTMTSMLSLAFTLPPVAGQISLICMIVGSVVILFMFGRDSKSLVKRLLKGIYGLYGATGYLSDILSYSRLLALGLATGVIAQVFNKIGAMFGGGILGGIVFTFAFLVGHSMNLGINLLGAYVNTNRLQFVEFLGKFYEGGGRKFLPFSANTKYYRVTEDINNG